MAFQVRAEIGIEDAIKRLDRLSKKLRTKVMKKAITKGAQAVAKMAKQLAPKRITFRKVRVRLGGRGPKKTIKKYGTKTSVQFDIGGATGLLTYNGGALKKSIGHKVRVYKRAVVAIVGPRDGFRERIGTVSRGKNKGKPIYNNPSKYAHLVELGTRHSKAQPFLRPAAEYGATVTASMLRDYVKYEIGAEAAK
jgi:HK97 gp10 family phage protein